MQDRGKWISRITILSDTNDFEPYYHMHYPIFYFHLHIKEEITTF